MIAIDDDNRVAAARPRDGRRWAGVLAFALASTAAAAERDICEHRTGQELIRCIEAAARGAPAPSVPAPPPAKAASASVPAAPPRGAVAPAAPAAAARAQAAPAPEPPRPAPEDCTGTSGETLRRCLAAGGRLAPEAAVTTPPQGAAAAAARQASCDGRSGEELRRCVETAAKAPRTEPGAQPQIVSCTEYTAADRPLCLHRNTALVECRNRQKYPDFEVCLRSFMARAPQPAAADCSRLQARSRTHCEHRNRVFQACLADKLGYFACLEQKLGAEARLSRRPPG